MTQVMKQFIYDEPVLCGDRYIAERMLDRIERKVGSGKDLVVIIVDRTSEDHRNLRTNVYCFWDFTDDHPLFKTFWGLINRTVNAARGVNVPL